MLSIMMAEEDISWSEVMGTLPAVEEGTFCAAEVDIPPAEVGTLPVEDTFRLAAADTF